MMIHEKNSNNYFKYGRFLKAVESINSANEMVSMVE